MGDEWSAQANAAHPTGIYMLSAAVRRMQIRTEKRLDDILEL